MSALNDETLLRRASQAQRNLTLLAVLASIAAAALLFLSFSSKSAPPVFGILTGTLALVASGYWVLAAAARRGDPNSVGIVLVIVIVQFALSLILSGVAAARTGGSFEPNTGGLVIPILVFAALYSSRKVLLELHDRGLCERAFGPAKPSRGLCMIGGTLLVAGFVALDSGTFYVGRKVSQQRTAEFQHAQAFARVIQGEELEFMSAMDALWRNNSQSQIQLALNKLNGLEQSVVRIKKPVAADGHLLPILDNYANALRQWKKGLLLLQEANPDAERAYAVLKLGDGFRSQAFEEFNRRYSPRRQPTAL